MEFLEVIFASTLVSAIITSIFTLLQKNKEGKLSHIVVERKKWRDDIRKIVSNINENEFVEIKISKEKKCYEISEEVRLNSIKKNVADLEVRLNTKDMLSKSNFNKDRELWLLIQKIEECKNFNELKQKKYLSKLRKNLSLLLKMDWERSKEETIGSSDRKQIFILMALQLLVCISFYLIFKNLFLFSTYGIDMTSIFSIIIFNLLCSFIFIFLYTQKLSNFLYKYSLDGVSASILIPSVMLFTQILGQIITIGMFVKRFFQKDYVEAIYFNGNYIGEVVKKPTSGSIEILVYDLFYKDKMFIILLFFSLTFIILLIFIVIKEMLYIRSTYLNSKLYREIFEYINDDEGYFQTNKELKEELKKEKTHKKIKKKIKKIKKHKKNKLGISDSIKNF